MSSKVRFSGIFPAIITPFKPDGSQDIEGLEVNTRFLLDRGVSGIVVNGSTGEAAALSPEERVRNIEAVARVCHERGKVVIAGAGAPATSQAVDLAKRAHKAGADALLVLTPYAIIPSRDGLYQYYRTVASSVPIPTLAYNLPQHTGVSLSVETLARLGEEGVISGLKDSSGNLSFLAEVVKEIGTKISVLTGGDDILMQSFVMGCSGAVIALGNIAPEICVKIFNAVQKGDVATARELYFRILGIARAISSSENFPAPVKEAVRLLGRPAGPCRSPIVEVSQPERESIKRALEAAGVLSSS